LNPEPEPGTWNLEPGTAARKRGASAASKKKGPRVSTRPLCFACDPAPQQLTAPCRKYSGRLRHPIEQSVYPTFSSEKLSIPAFPPAICDQFRDADYIFGAAFQPGDECPRFGSARADSLGLKSRIST
jgi:hypothetical protein